MKIFEQKVEFFNSFTKQKKRKKKFQKNLFRSNVFRLEFEPLLSNIEIFQIFIAFNFRLFISTIFQISTTK